MKNTSTKNNIGKFESSFNQLQSLLEELEAGDLSLEDSLKSFEMGVKLTRALQSTIAEAEQKVQLLIDQNGTPVSTDINLGEINE